MPIIKSATDALDLFRDIGGFRSPDEWFGGLVVFVNILAGGRDQFCSVVKDPTPQPVLSEIPEEAFDHVQP